MIYLYLLLSILAGVTVVLGRIINANLADKIGTIQSTVINYVVGLIFSLIFYLISSKGIIVNYEAVREVPVTAYLGGLLGVIIIMSSNYITPKISAFYITLIVFIGQLIIGALIDYFMLHELSIGKVFGGIFVIIGLTYNLFIDKKEKIK